MTTQVQALLEAVQEQRYDLLFEQHQMVVLAACIYAITRVLLYTQPFGMIARIPKLHLHGARVTYHAGR